MASISLLSLLPQQFVYKRINGKRICLIGIGGSGSKVVKQFSEKRNIPNVYTITNTTENVYRLFSRSNFIKQSPQNAFHYILVSGLGGNTSYQQLKPVAEYLMKTGAAISVVCTTPFKFEGIMREIRANEICNYFKNHDNFRLFHLNDIRDNYGNVTIASAIKYADEHVFVMINDEIKKHNLI